MLLVGLAVLAAFGLRLGVALTDDVVTNDAVTYVTSGHNIWEGNGYVRDDVPELHFPPFYPFVVGGVWEITGDAQSAVSTVTLLSGTLLILPLASIARLARGDRAGIAAAWIAALATGLTDTVVNSGSGNEAIYLLLLLLALRVSLAVGSRPPLHRTIGAALVGLLAGLAFLTRPEGLFYVPLLLAIVTLPGMRTWWRERRDRATMPSSDGKTSKAGRPTMPRLAVSALAATGLLVGLAVCVVPYAEFLHSHTGRWELTAKTRDASIEAWRAVAEHDREARDAVLYELDDTGLRFVAARDTLPTLARNDPSGYAGIVGVNIERLVTDMAEPVDGEHIRYGWALLPLPITLLGVWGAWRGRRNRAVQASVVALALPVATALAFFVQVRYLIPSIGFLCILAGVGYSYLRPRLRPWAIGTIAVLLAWSIVVSFDGDEGWFAPREPVEQREVGEWLAANTEPDARILTRSMITSFYADRETVPPPYTDIPTMLDFARAWGVDYLVFDEYNMKTLRPQFMPLVEGPVPDGLRLVHELEHAGRPVRVYSFDPAPADDPDDPPSLGFMADN